MVLGMSVNNSGLMYCLNQNKSCVKCVIKTFFYIGVAYSKGLTVTLLVIAKLVIINKIASYFVNNMKRREILEKITGRLESIDSASIEAVYLRELKEKVN